MDTDHKGFHPPIDTVKLLNFESVSSPLSDSDTIGEGELDRTLTLYDYELPKERIAQNPACPRDSSRLLVVDSPTHYTHRVFRDLPELLRPGDLLVLNNTRVIPARLYGHKLSGGLVEVLLLEERQNHIWLALVKPGRRLKPGARIFFEPPRGGQPRGRVSRLEWTARRRGHRDVGAVPCARPGNREGLSATVLEADEATGGRLLQFDLPDGVSLIQLLDSFGQVPLPPYITDSQADIEQYQTVYAQLPGAIAAPTAGLHFTPELLSQLQERGISSAFVTLHVGVGTFRPVDVEDITAHKMHEEWIDVKAETVEQISATQSQKGRIIAVGTTVVRALEEAAQSGQLQPFCGKTKLFIYPGYQWRVVEGLITNFHLPRSSLLMLVSALIGQQRLLELYQEAIASSYRFYSFGDAMLILPEARKI